MRTGLGVPRLFGLLAAVMVALGGCGPAAPATGTLGTSASPAVEPSSPGRETGQPPASPIASAPTASGSAGSGPVVDAGLLRVLPATIDGVALEPDPATAAQIAADPTLAGSVQAIAVALAIRPGTSSGDDLAIVSVIRLRLGVFDDAWFTTWRITYDDSACEVAGGVKGAPTQVSIAGRTVFVGTCAGEARTYHVHLSDPTLLVSITAAGAGQFGRLVVAGLAE